MAETLFYVLSVLALAGACGVVLAKNPLMSVLSLLSCFFALAVIYLLAGFQFMAAAQIIVYAGAILVLFLFVIMLLNLAREQPRFELSSGFLRGRRAHLAGILAVGLGLVGLIATQRSAVRQPTVVDPEHGFDPLNELALALFGRYSLPFEAASLLLLATMVCVIALAKRQRGPRSSGAQLGVAATPAPPSPAAVPPPEGPRPAEVEA